MAGCSGGATMAALGGIDSSVTCALYVCTLYALLAVHTLLGLAAGSVSPAVVTLNCVMYSTTPMLAQGPDAQEAQQTTPSE